jgi:hypothetical protein
MTSCNWKGGYQHLEEHSRSSVDDTREWVHYVPPQQCGIFTQAAKTTNIKRNMDI